MLKYDIFSLTQDMITKNDLKEITNPRLFIREDLPDPEGLASYEIFGLPGSDERKTTFAYIRLKTLIIHPHVLFELKSIKRDFLDLVYGNDSFYIFDGNIHRASKAKNPPKGAPSGTGTKFLYKHWELLDFDPKHDKRSSDIRKTRLRFLHTTSKKKVFMDKVLVIPPFYRDIKGTNDSKNEMNTYYTSLINMASALESSDSFISEFTNSSSAQRNIQNMVSEMYNYIIGLYGGRKGFIHENVMGKKIDHSARLVISCPQLSSARTPRDMPVSFTHSSVPLFALIKCFSPFIFFGIKEMIERYLGGGNYLWVRNKNGKGYERKALAEDWKVILTKEYIDNLIELYDESYEHRLDLFTLPLEDGTEAPVSYFMFNDDDVDVVIDPNDVEDSKLEPMRLIHLFYLAAYNTIRDKHIYITRYPIESQDNTYPSKININPYSRTKKVKIGDTVLPNFPIVNYEEDIPKIRSMFGESLVLSPVYLGQLTADFDGDQVSVVGVMTEEANKESHERIFSIGSLTSNTGESTRGLGSLIVHTIYNFTRF